MLLDGALFYKNNMKIVILSDDFLPRSFGGGGIMASWQAIELAHRGHDVQVITTVQEKNLEGTVKRDGFTIHNIYSNYPTILRDYVSFYNPQTIYSIKKIFKELKPDIVHIHNVHIHLSYHSIVLAKRWSRAVFLTAHDTQPIHLGKLYPKVLISKVDTKIFDYRVSLWQLFREYGLRVNPFRKLLIKFNFRKLNKIFAVSGALAESFRQNGIGNVEVMHNGIDVKAFSTTQNKIEEFKNKYNLQNKKVLLFGGRISIAKGGHVAVDLLIELSKTMQDVCLLIAGIEDDRVKSLLKRAEVAGVRDKVKATGWLDREEIISAYCASSVVLMPSLYLDPFPTVNLEAMASKKPVVGTCFGGTPEAVIDGETGYIVNPNDLPFVVERTLFILNNNELLEKFGQSGYAHIQNEFLLSTQIDKLEKEYSYYK
jgi:phosphatidylinositol alpha-1,6-mannosyltransferase